MKEIIDSLKQQVSKIIRNPNASEEKFQQIALDLFSFQFKHNLPYQQFCKMRKRTPMTVRHWTQIPAVPISAFKEASLSTIPLEQAKAIFMTSGTTRPEQKGKNVHLDLDVYDLSMTTQFKAFMLPDRNRMRMVTLFPSENTLPNSSLAHYLSLALKEFGDVGSQCVFEGEHFDKEWLVTLLRGAEQSATPIFLLGATFSFIHFLDHCRENGLSFHLPEGSRLMDTGGIKKRSRDLSPEQFVQDISNLFDIPESLIGNMYGMTELSSQFYDTRMGETLLNRPNIPPHWVRTRVVHPETMLDVEIGERGIIVHYDLANLYSVLAMMTEDVGIRMENGFVLLGRAEGAEARGCSLAVEEFIRSTEGSS
jgi:acyl-CoA synthetase (AMP-forming)/AMP-acid ligase II